MLDFTGEHATRALQRLQTEFTIWLTTVSPQGVAHPRPVWFIWEDNSFLIYSQPNTRKLQHIAHHPQVTLHFDGGPKGLDIQVLFGRAEIIHDPTPLHQVPAYVEKYGAEVQGMGATVEAFAAAYSVALRITPTKLRR